ncbi:Coenzyme F420 hydrogenase/dehydrogenase, beta subunit C-terminal domain [Aestuariivita boseongensis]|uniref:Coenzyme F420 hydrogenase/dehydrogenase, beta subunit C-terminal domain n=1 Tax=Aestuariivita boseongensis TaxID=1470562 RepID=UPI00068293E6|nr:Coenzyme F420 hydrogenase/dehydrogenase, beta subunit C-terminal domain [Aestuariivita boseongensis]
MASEVSQNGDPEESALPTAVPLRRIARGNLCSGCGACAGVFPGKIRMQKVEPGFLRPLEFAPLTDAEQQAFDRFCPALGQKIAAEDQPDDVLWGPYREMRTGWATDTLLRFRGASGGALSALLVHLLNSGEVEAIVQIADDPQNPIANRMVVSIDRDDILAAGGSRYAPSAPLERLSEMVDSGRKYAFVGKPCDAVALRALASERPEVAATYPIILSFFCAGVPSEQGARELIKSLGVHEDHVTSFRYRGHGWPGRATASLDDGTERSMSYHESWGDILSKHVQHRCKICADGTGKAADIVCADAWESDADGYPIFEEAEGVSLIVSRTSLGERILQEAVAAGEIEISGFDVDKLAPIQPGQRERRRALMARLLALRLAGRPTPRYRGLHLWAAARQNPFSRNLKNFLGMLRRVIIGRL